MTLNVYHHGGQALLQAMDFVTICRAEDPLGNYPHVGDLQWACRDGSLDDQNDWHFWHSVTGEVIALGMASGDEVVCLLHPRFDDFTLMQEVRGWAKKRIAERASQQVESYELSEEAADDEPEKIRFLENEGFHRQNNYSLRYHRWLDDAIPRPKLPLGFLIRSIAGESEVVSRAALQRDSFYPYTSKTYEEATSRYLGAMRMPGYNPHLDLVIVAPDSVFAAGCICWLDDKNKVGLFEPVGTRPQFRRKGLATALMVEGLRKMRECGMQSALVTATHPGEAGKSAFPEDFTSSRFVYEAVGFRLLRRSFVYNKTI